MGGTEEQGGVAEPAREIDPVERLFRTGDFRAARERAFAVVNDTAGAAADARERAQAVLDALRPDSAALWVLTGCVLLFCAVVWLTLF